MPHVKPFSSPIGQTLYVSKTAHRHSPSASVSPSASCGSPTPCENMPRIGSVERPRLSVSAEGLCNGHEENPDDDYFRHKRPLERSESTLSPSSHQKSKEPEIRRVASCPGMNNYDCFSTCFSTKPIF